MDQGWVYVLVNSSITGLAKVGRTTRCPADRAQELSAVTGVATPFVVAYDHVFEDCREAERLIHAELDRRGLRVAANREFFRGAASEIIRIIIEVAERDAPARMMDVRPCADRLRVAGDQAYFGQGDALQDIGEALRLYKLASARGSLIAFERMGQIYNSLYLASRDRPRRRRAFITLKEGARRGNYYCFGEMAALFCAEHHAGNFVKAWDLFFERHRDAPKPELEADPVRFAAACARYIAQALEVGLQPAHRTELFDQADNILAALLAELDAARGNPVARMHLSTALRWAYETLHAESTGARVLKQVKITPVPRWVSKTSIAPA